MYMTDDKLNIWNCSIQNQIEILADTNLTSIVLGHQYYGDFFKLIEYKKDVVKIAIEIDRGFNHVTLYHFLINNVDTLKDFSLRIIDTPIRPIYINRILSLLSKIDCLYLLKIYCYYEDVELDSIKSDTNTNRLREIRKTASHQKYFSESGYKSKNETIRSYNQWYLVTCWCESHLPNCHYVDGGFGDVEIYFTNADLSI